MMKPMPVQCTPCTNTIEYPVPSTIDNPVPYTTIDMNNQTSSGDLPPSYQQATNPKYGHYGFTSSK